jgi:hypothetical protein
MFSRMRHCTSNPRRIYSNSQPTGLIPNRMWSDYIWSSGDPCQATWPFSRATRLQRPIFKLIMSDIRLSARISNSLLEVYVATCAYHDQACTWISAQKRGLDKLPSCETLPASSTPTMRESFTTLPTEVIEEIMSYSSYSDISALARTSTRLWQAAAPRVRSVIPLLTSERMGRCIQYLADDPQRATRILEVHLLKLVPRRKPLPWCFDFIDRFFIVTLGRVVPLTFIPRETYPKLSRVFHNALCNMTRLRVLAVHSCQHHEIWECCIIIPSLRELFVYPGAESSSLWRWAVRQRSLITLHNCRKNPDQLYWSLYGSTYCDSVVFAALQTLITDPEGATELLPQSVVSDLSIQGLSKPSIFSKYPTHVAYSHWADYNPPFLYEIVRSNKRIPLRRITLSGTVGAICCVLQELESRHSLPPRVRIFLDLEIEKSQRDLVRQILLI